MFCCRSTSASVWHFCLPQLATGCSCDWCRPSTWTSLSILLRLSWERNQHFQTLFCKGRGRLLQPAARHLQVATFWCLIWMLANHFPGDHVLKHPRMIDWWDIYANKLDVSTSLSTRQKCVCLMRIDYWKCSHQTTPSWQRTYPSPSSTWVVEARDTLVRFNENSECFTWMCLSGKSL